jgi:hypothetical protein
MDIIYKANTMLKQGMIQIRQQELEMCTTSEMPLQYWYRSVPRKGCPDNLSFLADSFPCWQQIVMSGIKANKLSGFPLVNLLPRR